MPLKKYTIPRTATVADSTQLKQSKPRKSMARLVGISDIEWTADVHHREAVTTDPRRRLDAKRTKDVAAAVAIDQE
ncbi:hypothetical protein D1007_29169 [Hordeum vulgare]|nr:hypothetical protein D1007_29169 [Hordeum vulgare]